MFRLLICTSKHTAHSNTLNKDLFFVAQVLSIPDNDQLAAQVSTAMNADLLLLLSDVNGLYTGPPSDPSSRLIQTYYPEHDNVAVKFGAGSKVGRGGMESKVSGDVAAISAIFILLSRYCMTTSMWNFSVWLLVARKFDT